VAASSTLGQPQHADDAPAANEWRITEHLPIVAGQFADRSATAVAPQARRTKSPQDRVERVPDTFLQILALRQLAAVEMAAGEAGPEGSQSIRDAVEEFFAAIVVETTATDRAGAFKLHGVSWSTSTSTFRARAT